MIAHPSSVVRIFMNSSPLRMALNVLPSGCFSTGLVTLAGLAMAAACIRKMAEINAMKYRVRINFFIPSPFYIFAVTFCIVTIFL